MDYEEESPPSYVWVAISLRLMVAQWELVAHLFPIPKAVLFLSRKEKYSAVLANQFLSRLASVWCGNIRYRSNLDLAVTVGSPVSKALACRMEWFEPC